MKNQYKCFLILITLFSFLNLESKKPERIPSPTPNIKSRIDFLKAMPKNGIVAEIGVLRGEFSSEILKYTNPKHLYLIDPWKYINIREAGTARNHEKLYRQVLKKFKNDSRVTIIRAYSPKAADLFEDNFFDWVYIDANHSYEYVKKDLEAWFKKVKIEGFLAGHDYNYHPKMNFGVVPAVNEFIVKYNLNLSLLSTDRWSSYAIQKLNNN